MEIEIEYAKQGYQSTLANLRVDRKKRGYTLHDTDRGLTSTMTLAQIAKLKVHGRTAIPTGRYPVRMTFSKRFQRMMPEFVGVPGFAGIRLHGGNKVVETDGCPLPGETYDQDALKYYRVWSSQKVFQAVQAEIVAAEKRKEEIWCTVTRLYKV